MAPYERKYLQHVQSCHQVGVNAQDIGLFFFQETAQLFEGGKSRIKNLVAVSVLFQEGSDAEDAQRRIGLQNELFLLIFLQEITVREQDLHTFSKSRSMWSPKGVKRLLRPVNFSSTRDILTRPGRRLNFSSIYDGG